MLEIEAARDDADLARYTSIVARVVPQAAQTVAELKEIAKKEELVHLIASVDGEAVGAGFCSLEPRMRARHGAFAKIGVLPEHRNRGIGSSKETGNWMHAFSEVLTAPPAVEILHVDGAEAK